MDLREYREPYYDESGRLTTRPWPDERLGDILAAHLAGADCGSPVAAAVIEAAVWACGEHPACPEIMDEFLTMPPASWPSLRRAVEAWERYPEPWPAVRP